MLTVLIPISPERWPSGRRRSIRNRVYCKTVSWVRLPPSPPNFAQAKFASIFDFLFSPETISNLNPHSRKKKIEKSKIKGLENRESRIENRFRIVGSRLPQIL